ELSLSPAVFDRQILALDITGLLQALAKAPKAPRLSVRRLGIEMADHRHRRLLRPRRQRPCSCRAAECSQQFPPSDGDCHTPLPCEVRKGKDTTRQACCPI